MKSLLLLTLTFVFAGFAIAQTFHSTPTVTIQSNWNKKSGSKSRYDHIIKNAAGNILRTYENCTLFTSFAGDIFLIGKGDPETKFPNRKADEFGLVNAATGQEIYPCNAYKIEKLSTSIVLVTTEDKKYLFLKPNGDKFFDAPFDFMDIPLYWQKPKLFLMVKRNNKYGYVDSFGVMRIPLQYDAADMLMNGVARVRRGDKWTWVDSTLKEVGPARYTFLNYFTQGMASYSTTAIETGYKKFKGGKLGLLNKEGILLTPEIYDEISFNGPTISGTLNGEWVNINFQTPGAAPSQIIPLAYRTGINTGRYGYKIGGYDGDWLVKPKYDYATEFKNGYAFVGRKGKDKDITLGGNEVYAMEYGLINMKGEEVIPIRYKSLWLYEPGLYGFAEGKGYNYTWRMGIIDSTGTVRLPANYKKLGPLNNGIIAAQNEKGYGYMDLSGKMLIDHKYYYALPFVNGIACVADNLNAWYWIDKTGKEILPGRRFTSVSDWDSTGKAWTWNKMDKWNRPDSGVRIDRTGQVTARMPMNSAPPPPVPGKVKCWKCNGSGMAYKSRDVNSSFTYIEGMFKPVETHTTYSYSYRVYEKDGYCTACNGTGYEHPLKR